jgi:hypothetical protein
MEINSMENILILITTMGMLFYFIQLIWKDRKHLFKYISTVGKEKPAKSSPKPGFWLPLLIFYGIFGVCAGYFTFLSLSDEKIVFRLLLALIAALIFLLLLYTFIFWVVVIVKEIISMKDKTINFILIYSIIAECLLFTQIYTDRVDYPKEFILISAVLYAVNIFSIGRIIWTIFRKKLPVKSIWSIAFLNTGFAVIALSNIVFEIQKIYPSPCYSRTINSWGDSLYFVVITFFTVGYGDLYPVVEITKILTIIIIFSGFSFTAVFVSAALSATVEHFGSIEKK